MDRRVDRCDRPVSDRRCGVTSPVTARPRTTARIVRFDTVQRTAHWVNALLFGILMVTALPLYFGSIAGVVGRRALVEQIHLWAGIALTGAAPHLHPGPLGRPVPP